MSWPACFPGGKPPTITCARMGVGIVTPSPQRRAPAGLRAAGATAGRAHARRGGLRWEARADWPPRVP